MLEAKNISKRYGNLSVLSDVSMMINKGEIIAIVGPSGAGKSTLLQLLGTLDKPDSGNIIFKGTDIQNLGESALAKFRNQEIGFIFQFHNLLPEFSALENVCIPSFIAGNDRKYSESTATELLNRLSLGHRLRHRPSEMSGGEQQRVAIARALMNRPSIIFADEPSGNLDSANAKELHHLFLSLRADFNQTFVIVTHNNELADMADRKIFMRDGSISES